MKQIFDWLREHLEETAHDVSPNTDKLVVLARVERLINEAEAKWEADIVNQLAMMYAESLTKYGVDLQGKFETATQMTIALNEAYLRGRHDERIKISEVE